jgi:hypothetical protein
MTPAEVEALDDYVYDAMLRALERTAAKVAEAERR